MNRQVIDAAAAIILASFLAFVVYAKHAGGLGVLNGHPQVPTTGEWKLIRTEKEYDNHAIVTVTVGHDTVHVPLWIRDNQLYGPEAGSIPAVAESGDAVKVGIKAERDRFYFNPMSDRLDLGAWAGRSSLTNHDGNQFDVGVRWGVFRMFDDVLAADLVGSDHEVGVGVSFHLPPDRFPGVWHHLGLGWARVLDFHDERSGSVVALSFNSR